MEQITATDLAKLHWFAVPDGFLLLDINSGSVMRIDKDTAACLGQRGGGDFGGVGPTAGGWSAFY